MYQCYLSNYLPQRCCSFGFPRATQTSGNSHFKNQEINCKSGELEVSRETTKLQKSSEKLKIKLSLENQEGQLVFI